MIPFHLLNISIFSCILSWLAPVTCNYSQHLQLMKQSKSTIGNKYNSGGKVYINEVLKSLYCKCSSLKV